MHYTDSFFKFAARKKLLIKNLKMNTYETVFIMNPVLSEDQVKETVKRYASYLKSNNAEIVSEENWGLKKLKYAIQKKKSGFYYLIEYKANGAILPKMDVEFKRDETVLRWLTVRLDKFAAEYAVRRKNRLSETKKSAE